MAARTRSAATFVATATLPDGRCKRFRELPCFDYYVSVWRRSGFLITWHDPWTVVITRGGLDAGPQRPIESLAHPGNPSTLSETSNGQV